MQSLLVDCMVDLCHVFSLFSALASIIKCILAMHYKEIAANLNFNTPNPEIKGIAEGKLKVVDKTMPLSGELIPANLNYNTPNPEIKGIAEGKLKVVDKTMPLSGE